MFDTGGCALIGCGIVVGYYAIPQNQNSDGRGFVDKKEQMSLGQDNRTSNRTSTK